MAQPTLIQVIKSVLSAFIGVQNSKNRAVDFQEGKLSHYIIVGIIAALLFIATLVFVVSLIL